MSPHPPEGSAAAAAAAAEPVRQFHLHLPGTVRCSPDLARAQSHNVEWLREHGALTSQEDIDDYLALRLPEAFSCVFPDLAGDELDLAIDWLSWTFLFDDVMGSASAAAGRTRADLLAGSLTRVLAGEPAEARPSVQPVVSTFRDLWHRERTGMSDVWRSRAAQHWREQIAANALETDTRLRNVPLSVDDYLLMRRSSITFVCGLDLCERVRGFEIDARMIAHDTFRTLRDDYTDIIILIDDYYGWRKEVALGDPHCLVPVLQRERGHSLPAAVEATGDLLQARLDSFRVLRDIGLPSMCDELGLSEQALTGVGHYVAMMNEVIRTATRFLQQLARFQAAELPTDHPRYIDRLVMGSPADAPPNVPQHLGVIPDGNRRWARRRGLPPEVGHERGVARMAQVVGWCQRAGIEVVTLYMLSAENLTRGADERLADFAEMLLARLADQSDLRLRPVGQIGLLPPGTRDALEQAVGRTAGNRGTLINLALGYSGRHDIAAAARALVRDSPLAGWELAELITAESLQRHISTAGQPDPDLIIRTSGEQRLSGFLTWQAEQAELYFCAQDWPDFDATDFEVALRSFAERDRRFGR